MTWSKRLLVIAALLTPASLLAQQPEGTITGIVADSGTALPVGDASVELEGTSHGARTGADGRFTISGVAPGTYQLQVRRIGFAPQARAVTVTVGQTVTINFELVPQAAALSEVVSIGYGTQSRRDITGSVATVNTDATEDAPVPTIDQMLQGTAPGVQVTTASSEPGGALSIRIRGTSSITGNAEPLYVIDGFPIENDIEGSSVGNGGRERTTPPNPLSTLNPSDIESISILKDASATAIYGARGANGVVIITTRQGYGTQPQFSLDYYAGSQSLARKYPLLNAAEYMDYANEYAANSSSPYEPFPAAVKAEILAAGLDTDWQDELFRTGSVRNVQLGVRGATSGGSPTRYAISAGTYDNDGIVLGSGLRRYSGRVNLNQAMGDRVQFGANFTAAQVRTKSTPTAGQQNSNAGAVSAALQYVPILPVYREDGTYSEILTDLNAYATQLDAPSTPNPISLAREVSDSLGDTRVLGNLFGEIELIEGLRLRVSGGADYASRWRYTYYPRTTMRGAQSNGDARRSSASTAGWLNENTLTYDRVIGPHRFDVLGGYTRQRTDVAGENMTNSNFVSDITGYNDIGSGTQPDNSSRRSTQTLESWLGRINYSLLDRYLVTLTLRADGSSRFAEGHKWGRFPSAAVAWRLSSEPWMERFDRIDELKLRASYGVTGNPSIRPYQSLARLGDQGYSFGGTPYSGYSLVAVGNPDLTWESTEQVDIGVDVGLWGRVSLVADYYRKETTDLLLLVDLPLETGFESALANVGAVENRGFELGIDAEILRPAEANGFGWRANLNYARNRNEVTDLGGQDHIEAELLTTDYNLPGTWIQVGQPIGVFYGFISDGVIRDQAEADAITWTNFNGAAFEPGDMKVRDVDGDGALTLDDRTIIGDPTPDYTLGLTNTFSYRGFELSGLLQGSFGGEVLNVNRIRTESSPRVNISHDRWYGRWTPENTDAEYPKIGENPNQVGTNNFTTNLLEDGTYIRLRTLTLSYSVLESLLERYGVGATRVYLTGTNLFTITDYTGYDPDVSGQSVGNTNRGIDIGAYPLARTFTFGLRFNY